MKTNKYKMLTLKGAILDKSRLCQYLEKLGTEHITIPNSDESTWPIPNLKENYKFIYETYQLLNNHANLKITVDPAGEWLLDNFYILEEAVKSIEKELTKRKYKNLVGLGNGIYKGFARSYVLASEIVAYTDGEIKEETLKILLNAYQSKNNLTMEETWNFPVLLQIVIIHNIRELCEKIYNSQIQKYKAESIIERLIDKKEKQNQIFNEPVKRVKHEGERINYAFIEYLSYKLKSYGKRGASYLQILEDQVNKMGTNVADVIKQVHFSLAVNKVSMGNLITSLKEISRMDFSEITKEIGGTDELLRQDPAGIYEYMDYKTKSDYQNKIQEISRKTKISEIYIAKILLELAKTGKEEKQKHIGYYLFEKPNLLYRKLEIKEKRFSKENKSKAYICVNILLPLYLCFAFFAFFYCSSMNFLHSFFISVAIFFPLTEIVSQILCYILGKFVKPKRIPKMDYSNGIPKESATFVVIPTILNNKEKVKQLMRNLEVYSWANKSENLYFALLGDVSSGMSENESFDSQIIMAGEEEIKKLNNKYKNNDGFPKFHFLYRKRTWNRSESCFLGWERKRGLLIQFNEFLLNYEKNDFKYNSIISYRQFMPKIKYIITLDADTNLVLDTAFELVGAMDHILNKPIISENKVVNGHALMQPRIGVNLQANSASTFSKIFALTGGTDLYTNAVSDVYQDNFDEGIFTGKGIYNLNIFSKIITEQIPENTVLSHDLLEGNYLRCGLISDVMLLDGFPSKYNSYMTRLKRWIRGDWQIIKWVMPKVKNKNGIYVINPLNILSKFKIIDNMRRSIVPISLLLLLFLGISIPSPYNISAMLVAVIGLAITTLIAFADKIVFKKEIENGFVNASKNFLWKVSGVTGSLIQSLLEIAFLPYKAYISICAIIKTIYRVFISKKNLLEWLTAEEAEKQAKTNCSSYYKQMWINVLSGILIFMLAMQNGDINRSIIGIVIAIFWFLGPYIAYVISRPLTVNKNQLSKIDEQEKQYLLEIAKRTWKYFSCYMNSENNYLPPDNYEENRKNKIAMRTSPTNIGLGLLSIISAIDFTFISLSEGIELIKKCVNTIENLPKWNGHLYNWYNTKTLEPLSPKYISTVDSGNFICYLYVLKQFLESKKSSEENETIKCVAPKIDKLIYSADFSKLYDIKKRLFSIGYHLEDGKLTDSYYDLLASEARQTSLVAIAKKDIPAKHWNSLSRTLTVFHKYKGLISWSGTAFEYLMPNMIIPNYPGSLLEESCKFMVLCQKEYCKKLGLPWGISEAAFSVKDFQGNYQYKAFGIPWLGLKRGLADDRVVSSYGSIMALPDFPRDVIDNLQILDKEKMLDKYGLYESIDYTPTRQKIGTKKEIVKTYMAHHQGLILLALNNFFNNNIMVKRFMKNPEIESVDILLQERMPKFAILTKEKKEKIDKIRMENFETYSQRIYTKQDEFFKQINVISNNGYTINMDENGRGFSKYNGVLINKFKEGLDKEQGIFFFIKNIKTKRIWSQARLPFLNKPDKYKITFLPDSNIINRIDGNIESKTQITIAPEEAVEIRRMSLKNIGNSEDVLEISSFLEPVLSFPEQDYAHSAFNNLFLSFEWEEDLKALIVKRKKRGINEQEIYMGVCLYSEKEGIVDIEYEIDEEDFMGRGNCNIPEKIQKSTPFSNTIKLVPEGVAAMRKTIKLLPQDEVQITLLIATDKNKDKVINMLKQYQNSEKIEQTFKLARAKTQAENRYLKISQEDTELYQKILGYLLIQNPLKTLYVLDLPKTIYPQRELWSMGISGDIPILLIRIKEPNDSYVVEQILKAKEFFLLKMCDVDIVILNEERNVYEQYVKEKIESSILERHLSYLIGQKNGIFILNTNELEKKQINGLIFHSNLIFDACKGKLKEQLEEQEENYIDSRKQIGFEQALVSAPSNKGQITLDTENLKYYNEYGGFSKDGLEYIIKTTPESPLPTTWAHVIANENFGTIVTEQLGGFTWNQNSRLNRMTSWNNIPYLDIPSEILYIKEKQTGKVWSNSSFISKNEGDFKATYGFGYAVYTNLCNDFLCETRVFVPKEDRTKITLIKLKNKRADRRTLKLIYYIKPVLGEDEQKTRGFLDLSKKNNYLTMKNLANEDFNWILYLGSSEKIKSYTGDKQRFIGNGNIFHPDGIDKVALDGENSLGKLGCIAFEVEIELDGFETKEVCIYMGQEQTENRIQEVVNKYNSIENCYQELSTIKKFWYEKINHIQVKTPAESMNLMLNGWLVYQTIACRLWARSGYYQSGGAYGFRDQLQDTLGLRLIEPELMKMQILRACKHQFIEGDVEHWWHDETSRGIRTKFSDDLLWLPYTVAKYCNTTGDFEILEEDVEYLKGDLLSEGTDEKYDIFLGSGVKENVYMHCIRALTKGICLGENGLPKIGSGDWNDGFNTVGNLGRGESVWLGFFLYKVLDEFIPICERRGEVEKVLYYKQINEHLKKTLNTKGWDGRWFRRAFTDNGEILGSIENEECKIDSISQSWAVLSDAGDNDKKYIAMESLENYLIDKTNGVIKLLTPPFEKSSIEPGYIKSYLPGVRENGGQYTHGAIWAIMAQTRLGLGEKATEYFRMINPIEHSRTKDEAKKYKVEPYVVTGDVYGEENLAGRGGWTWYTGSSSWLYQAGLESILGLNVENGKLKVMPNISPNWKEYSIRYKYKNSIYYIKVKNQNGKTSGIKKMLLNGNEIIDKVINLDGNGGNYEVEIEM